MCCLHRILANYAGNTCSPRVAALVAGIAVAVAVLAAVASHLLTLPLSARHYSSGRQPEDKSATRAVSMHQASVQVQVHLRLQVQVQVCAVC